MNFSFSLSIIVVVTLEKKHTLSMKCIQHKIIADNIITQYVHYHDLHAYHIIIEFLLTYKICEFQKKN